MKLSNILKGIFALEIVQIGTAIALATAMFTAPAKAAPNDIVMTGNTVNIAEVETVSQTYEQETTTEEETTTEAPTEAPTETPTAPPTETTTDEATEYTVAVTESPTEAPKPVITARYNPDNELITPVFKCDYTTAQLNAFYDNLYAVPRPMLDCFIATGFTLQVQDSIVYDGMSCAGLTDWGARTMYININSPDSIIHEMAHVADSNVYYKTFSGQEILMTNFASSTNEFLDIFAAEKYTYNGNQASYASTNSHEFFACIVKDIYSYGASGEASAPRAYAFVRNYLATKFGI